MSLEGLESLERSGGLERLESLGGLGDQNIKPSLLNLQDSLLFRGKIPLPKHFVIAINIIKEKDPSLLTLAGKIADEDRHFGPER